MRLDASYLHFISQQQLRVMTSIELGMRNHEWVPAQVIGKISKLRGGQTYKVLIKLLKNKFVVHTGKRYDGYKLTYLGYDYLALQTFLKRGILKDVICKIGVGKESDIYKCVTPQGDLVVLKLTRLGRNSFRSVKKNREYIGNRTNYNWLYLSRLSSVRQFLFMQLLYQNDFQTPKPIDTNRHAIVMSLIQGSPLCHITRIGSQQQIKSLFEKARDMLIRFAENGLIHGDYNQFNLITNDEGTKLTVIDFPQCISVNHPNAEVYFNRDVECVYKFFDKMVKRELNQKSEQNEHKEQGDMSSINKKKFILNVGDYPMPILAQIQVKKRLDRELKTKGHITLTEEKELQKVMIEAKENQYNQDLQEDSDYNQDDEEESQQQNIEAHKEQENQFDEDEENEQQEQQGKQSSEEKQSAEEKIQNNFLQEDLKKMSFNQIQGELELQQISKSHHETQQIYDKQLESLMSELSHSNLSPQFINDPLQNDPFIEEKNNEEESQEERPQFKGLSAYQIRQKIKEEKRLEREKRKQQMTEDQYIKNAIKKTKKKDNSIHPNRMIGNRGNKKRNKINADNIKFGYELM